MSSGEKMSSKPITSLTLSGFAIFLNVGAASGQAVGGAQQGSPDDTLSLLTPASVAARSFREGPTREYQGLPIAGWMLKPTLLVGGVYDDNLFNSQTHRVGAAGLSLRPTFTAERKTGLHDTVVYLNGELRVFPDQSSGDTVNAKTGFTHSWEVQRDLTLKANAEYRVIRTNITTASPFRRPGLFWGHWRRPCATTSFSARCPD